MRIKLITSTLLVSFLSIIILGCDNSQSSGLTSENSNGDVEKISNIGQGDRIQLSNSNLNGPSQYSGIWVTGSGTIYVEPDLAIITLGVEYSDEYLKKARSNAADSMEQIIETLEKYSILDKDIQTDSFNIRANYEYLEIKSGNSTKSVRELVGYTVTNKAIVKIRELEDIGNIIDDTILAGGDSTRVDNINFNIDDTTAFGDQARGLAVKNAISKAKQYANLSGVKLGNLIYISEIGGNVSSRDFSGESFMTMASPRAVTPINTGQLNIQVSVQMVFQIN